MSRPSPAKRPVGRTTGANTLITATSLALTLGGWAALTGKETSPPEQAAVVVAIPEAAPVALPPLPTLVPPPTWPNTQEVSVGEPARDAPPPSTPVLRRVAPPVRVAPTAAPPVEAARPPKPVAVTRSSR